MENSSVQVTNTFRYLGVVLDGKLLFRNHINTLERKIARSIGLLLNLDITFRFQSCANYNLH